MTTLTRERFTLPSPKRALPTRSPSEGISEISAHTWVGIVGCRHAQCIGRVLFEHRDQPCASGNNYDGRVPKIAVKPFRGQMSGESAPLGSIFGSASIAATNFAAATPCSWVSRYHPGVI